MSNFNLAYKTEGKSQYKFVIFLSIFYFVGWASTYTMVYKMVSVDHVLETGAIFLFPLSYAIADVIAEVYGYRLARQIIWSSLLCGLIFVCSIEIIARMPAAPFWPYQNDYAVVFNKIIRAYFSLTIASLLGNFINIYVISKWKILMHGKHFWIRSLVSTGVGELLFTVIGGTLAYVGVEPWTKIVFLMLDGYLFKMIYAFIAVWPAVMVAGYLKKIEGVDVYDYNISYNPFKLSL